MGDVVLVGVLPKGFQALSGVFVAVDGAGVVDEHHGHLGAFNDDAHQCFIVVVGQRVFQRVQFVHEHFVEQCFVHG